MSSNAANLSPNSVRGVNFALSIGLAACVALAAPLAAQDDQSVTGGSESASETEAAPAEAPAEQPRRTRRQFTGIDLTVTVPREESDRLLEEDCEEEADAARIANEIVVCRQVGTASDGSWNKEEWEADYAARTQGRQPVNTFGIPNHGNSISIGGVPPPALIIDVEALPQAPEGSDADRIARGLPALGRDPEPSAEEIAERRRALGLDTPPLPDAP
ncbi:MAG: hypothetical protein AAF697_08080 [Pseudomonadota bacterium]